MGTPESSFWFDNAQLGDSCGYQTRCEECEPNGNCERCESIDGRWIEVVCEYASTCDGCGELTMHELMKMDMDTELGYCDLCVRVKR